MKDAINFLIKFEKANISIEDMANELKISEKTLSEFFSDHKNYSEELSEKIKVKSVYQSPDGTIDTSSFAHLNKENKKIPQVIYNRQYLNPQRALDLFLSERLFGRVARFGSVDYGDIGGLYRDAWVDQRENEIPFYSTESRSVDDLIIQLNNSIFEIKYERGFFTASTKHEGELEFISFTGTDISEAVSRCVEKYLLSPNSKKRYVVGQQYSDDEENVVDTVSKIYDSPIEAQEHINSIEDKDGYIYTVIKL